MKKVKMNLCSLTNSNKTKFIQVDIDTFIIEFPTIKLYIDIKGNFGNVINKRRDIFDNNCFFDDVINDYFIKLFHMPKQNDEQSKINVKVIKSLYKRIFGI